MDDLNEFERKDAVLDSKNRVLCPVCKKRLAIVTEYGMVRTCNKCERPKCNIMVSIDEPSGRRYY